MKASRRKLEEISWCFGVHKLANRAYGLLRPQQVHLSEDLKQLYSTLMPKGALAFDIGANVGTYAEALESLGAHIVAVDANADCLRHIELMYSGRNIQVVHAAVGSRTGLVTFNMSDQSDGISAIPSDWLESLNKHYGRSQQVWNRSVTVPMITVDCLVRRFGAPYYIKIDIEGYDGFALEGISTQPPLLSFEFHRVCLHSALDCLDKKVISPESRFNIHLSGPTFLLPAWVNKDEMKKTLVDLRDLETYGDIYVAASQQITGDESEHSNPYGPH
jgi:FkbM family methyltransferase